MFLHNLKYELISSFRAKALIGWLIFFPMILGSFFKITFTGIYDKAVKFNTIPAAVIVSEECENDTVFKSVMDRVTEGDQPFLSVVYTDSQNALDMLEKEKIKGIINYGDELSLTVNGKGAEQSALRSFAEQYNHKKYIITEAIKNDPASAEKIIESLSREYSPISDVPLTHGNTDYFIQYFYNLIAMVAVYGSVTGLHITITNQANLSELGARKCCSPTPKSIGLGASLIGSYIVQGGCMVICVTFVRFVLGVEFGSRLPLVYIAALFGGILGVSFGFCIGSLSRCSTGIKTGICMASSMISCFLSGLMVGDMKAVIADKIPVLNNINPASVISDCFYCLNIDNDYSRFVSKIITMLIMSAAFAFLGFIITRRKKYADI